MRRNILSIIIFLFPPLSATLAFSEMKTFVKEYTYQASDIDSKVSCRTIALEQVKRLLLEELGTYIESTTEVNNYQLTKDQIIVLAGGVVQTRLIEEKWDGKLYRVKVEVTADPNDVLKSINELRKKDQLSRELLEAKMKVDDALKEIERLKKAGKTTKSGGEKFELQKKYEEEIKTVEKYELWQKEYETIMRGSMAHDKGNYDEAIYISKIILANPNSEHKCHSYTLLGESYRDKGMYQDAVDALSMTIKLCSTSAFAALAHEYLGRTYGDMKLYKPAISEFKKALTLLYDEKKRLENRSPSKYDPDLSKYDLDLLFPERFQQRRDSIDEKIADNHFFALEIYILGADSFIGLKAAKPDALLPREGYVQIPKEAMEEFDKVLALKPNSLKHLRTFHEMGFGKFKEIISWCEKLIKLNPNNGEIYFIRGSNYLRLEIYQQAIKDISVAIELNPNVPKYYERRGGAYFLIGIYNHAVKDYDKAIELNPTYAEAYFGRSICQSNKILMENDLKIAARLGHEGARQFLKERWIQW